MDTQETAIYQVIILAAVVICSILIYSFITALRQQARYRHTYTREMGAGINNLEDERKKIAADLHDDLGPVLSATKMKLSGISSLSPPDTVLVNKSIEYIELMTGKIRTIASGLMPSVLLDKGLVPAVEEFIDNLDLENNVRINLNAGHLPLLDHHAAIQLYRILQEIINNTCKHACASVLKIDIHTTKNCIIIATADDGIGFDFKKSLISKKGYGLSNIERRVQLLNGNLSVNSVVKKGTRYYIEIPLSGLHSKVETG